MVIAGIDEAGYGPLLGPLVVGCCAFEVQGHPPDAELPCLWSKLKKLVSKNRLRSGKKIHVNDSKAVYSPSIGIKELERGVLSIAASYAPWPENLKSFLAHVSPDVVAELDEYPWYRPAAGERFPCEIDGMGTKLFANGLRHEMDRVGTRCVHYAARVLPEKQLNRQLIATRNKSSVLFSVAAMHLDHLLRHYGTQNLVIYCDRQGGREHYGHLLRLMFDEWSLEIIGEADGRSEYRLHRGDHSVQIVFCEKAEAQCMSVAAASMLCKYLREVLMRRFNAYWREQIPGVAPTAGYYSDGMRFLKEIDARRLELGIPDDHLIRCR
ncbi:MAG TPA: hypothetical protein VFE58_02530 [Tepidisphaeraceae bacterium]|jgi:ribonuclease HII|nr:hypothetical protein [Tepidisphaeraceae bacterium]